LDNSPIYSVIDFINQTIVKGWDVDDATVWANLTLPDLTEGSHTITVYFGWQFEGVNQRYDVVAYSIVDFMISYASDTTLEPTPTVPEFPIVLSLVAVLAAVTLLLVIGKRKLAIEH